MTVFSSILALFSIRNKRIRFCRFLGIYMVVTGFSKANSYELKDIACHDVMEETVNLHLKWFPDQDGMGRCLDKHGIEYQGFDTVRSCSGCLTFQCVGGYDANAHRNEYFWNISSEYNVDKRCCKNCEGKVFPEGTEMGIASTEEGKCTTEVKTTCLYNPANGQGEITEDHSLKDCCLDSDGLHQIATQVMEPDSCSMRECRGVSKHRGHSSPYWVTKQSFPDCHCCQLDGSMIPPGGWILSNNTVNLTCCEGKLLATTTKGQNEMSLHTEGNIQPTPTSITSTTTTTNTTITTTTSTTTTTTTTTTPTTTTTTTTSTPTITTTTTTTTSTTTITKTITTTKSTTKTTTTTTTTTSTTNTTATTTYTTTPDAMVEGTDMPPAEKVKCGMRNTGGCIKDGRIVNGQEAGCNEWPWQVGIVQRDGDSVSTSPFCGGTLINENHVITAAHCMPGSTTSSIAIMIGDHSLTIAEPAQRAYGVSAIYNHPFYSSSTQANDITVLKLSVYVNTTLYSPACFPSFSSGQSLIGKNGTISGWGALEYATGDYPEELQEVQDLIPIVDRDTCVTNTEPYIYDSDIMPGMLCAGGPGLGMDTCQGDSGGPLTHQFAPNQYQLVGVVSWGRDCAKSYGVYSDVAYYKAWIESKTGPMFMAP